MPYNIKIEKNIQMIAAKILLKINHNHGKPYAIIFSQIYKLLIKTRNAKKIAEKPRVVIKIYHSFLEFYYASSQGHIAQLLNLNYSKNDDCHPSFGVLYLGFSKITQIRQKHVILERNRWKMVIKESFVRRNLVKSSWMKMVLGVDNHMKTVKNLKKSNFCQKTALLYKPDVFQ